MRLFRAVSVARETVHEKSVSACYFFCFSRYTHCVDRLNATGTLTFMVGGSEEAFERAKPVLSNMGKNVVLCGGVGNGQVVKICNNLVLGISMIGVSEAMNLGVQLGMDAKTLAGIFNTSSARCWSSDTYNPVPGE